MATGGLWQSKLLYVQYEGTKVHARYEFFSDLSHVLNVNTGIFAAPTNSPLRSKITKVSAFKIDLPVKAFVPFKATGQVLSHHIVEMEAKSGECFTLEKGKEYILLQSCRRISPEEKPIIRHQRNGKDRGRLKSLKRIVTELNPKAATVLDLLLWMNDKGSEGKGNF